MSSGHGETWVPLGKQTLPTEDADSGLGHIVPIRAYKMVFSLLIVLTLVTVWAADQDFGVFNLVVAIGIASIKAAMVTLFFMHLNWESKIAWGIVIYPLFIFILILCGTLGDEMVRTQPTPSPSMERLSGQSEKSKAAEGAAEGSHAVPAGQAAPSAH